MSFHIGPMADHPRTARYYSIETWIKMVIIPNGALVNGIYYLPPYITAILVTGLTKGRPSQNMSVFPGLKGSRESGLFGGVV